MPIKRLGNLRPDEIATLNLAFSKALRALHLVNRNDPITEIVARKIVEIGATGVRDPTKIAEIAVKQLRLGAQRAARLSQIFPQALEEGMPQFALG